MFEKTNLYWQTLRHLRPVQFYGRAWFHLARPRPDLSPPPELRPTNSPWQRPARRVASLIDPEEFYFLGVPGNLVDVGWDGPKREKLWRYNQHYFDDLNALDAISRRKWHLALLANWVEHNPPGIGSGWEPYPTSLRIVNWIKWALADNKLPEFCLESLAIQTRWLTKRLEYHLLGNHLFSNAKALVFSGLFFKGDEADHWLATGMKILAQQIPEQILPDGGHFERSTMYHALALEDMLDLSNLFQCYREALSPTRQTQAAEWSERIEKMHHWLYAMSHPDSEIGFFNDAALGIAPTNSELEGYAQRLGVSSAKCLDALIWLKDSGYARLSKDQAVALVDMAPVGPDYLLGHGHADTLSFEFSLFDHRVLVNSGTSCYGISAERLRQRGTAAHNTVSIEGQNSSEVWSGFRVARRARAGPARVQNGEILSACCSHDGYRRLAGRPVHERTWTLQDGQLTIADTISTSNQRAEARFHFHPDVRLTPGTTTNTGEGLLPNGEVFSWAAEPGKTRIEPTTWHPSFGKSIPNSCLVIELEQGQSQLALSWEK